MDIDHLLDEPIVFPPPGGQFEWAPVHEWGPAEWGHWLRGHNAYPFLQQWSEAAITQYVEQDRYRYGIFMQRAGTPRVWFYNPTPVAVPFHSSKIPNLLFGGAAGGSKSHTARHDAYRHCLAIPEFRAIIMRRTFEELSRNHLDKARQEAERFNAFYGKTVIDLVPSAHEIRFDCHGPGRESKIIFGHCQNVGDEEKYLGDAYDAFYPDEMATFEKKQIIGIAGRLRSEKRGIVARMGGTSNPGGAHTLWLKQWFIDKDEVSVKEENPRYSAERYQFLPAMLYDNPFYMDPDGSYQTYEERLFAYDAERRKQLLLGDWSALSGQFLPEFNLHRHVGVLDIPPNCKIERWVDWGYDPHYGICLWVACLPNGRLYVFYEWKFNGAQTRQKFVASEVATRIRHFTTAEVLPLARCQRITKSIADPSMWSKDGHSGEDYAQTFARSGVALTPADNERVMGWGRLRHWLRPAPDGHPWLMLHPRCVTTIRTLPGLVRDKNDPDDVDTTGEDHPADAIRYGVMARPSPTHLREEASVIADEHIAEAFRQARAAQIRLPGMVS